MGIIEVKNKVRNYLRRMFPELTYLNVFYDDYNVICVEFEGVDKEEIIDAVYRILDVECYSDYDDNFICFTISD